MTSEVFSTELQIVKDLLMVSPRIKDIINEIKSAQFKLNEEQARYIQSKSVLSAIQQTLRSDSLSPDLCEKILLLMHKDCLVSKYKNEVSFNMLDIDLDFLNKETLEFSEKTVLKSRVKKHLNEMCADVESLRDEMSNDLILKNIHKDGTVGPNTLISDRKLNSIYLYCELLTNLEESLERLCKIKNVLKQFTSCHPVIDGYADNFKTNAEKLEIKAKIYEVKVMKTLLNANTKVSEASVLLHSNLKQKKEELEVELKRLQLKLADYQKLKGTRFEKILQEYVKIQKGIKSLKWVVELVE